MKGVSGDVIILEEAVRACALRAHRVCIAWLTAAPLASQAYCDPGLVSEVYAKATPRPRRRCSRLTRRVLVRQRRAVAFNAAIRFALYFNYPRLGKPCALPCSAATALCVIV